MTEITPERLAAAYAALGSLDYDTAVEYWHEDVRWNSPGVHEHAGWYEGLPAFLEFMRLVGKVSGGTWNAEPLVTLVGDGWTADASRTVARRPGKAGQAPTLYDSLDLEGIHLMRWVDGRIVEGRGAMFGNGQANFDLWWSPVAADHRRTGR